MKPIIVFVIALAVGGATFYGGMQYQKSQSFAGRTGTGARRMGNGQPVSGEILNIDDTSLTVKLADGSSRIVLFTDKTVFNKTATVEKTELKIGEKVGVFGISNVDGSVTAQNIQLNPQFRMSGQGGNRAIFP